MGYDRKFGRVTTEHGDIPEDEPVFVIRGKDAAAPMAISHYADAAVMVGASDEFVDEVRRAVETVCAWQADHLDRIRAPDNTPEQLKSREET